MVNKYEDGKKLLGAIEASKSSEKKGGGIELSRLFGKREQEAPSDSARNWKPLRSNERHVSIILDGEESDVRGRSKSIANLIQAEIKKTSGDANVKFQIKWMMDNVVTSTTWSSDPRDAGNEAQRSHCWIGTTQIGNALRDISRENTILAGQSFGSHVDCVILVGSRFSAKDQVPVALLEDLRSQDTVIHVLAQDVPKEEKVHLKKLSTETNGLYVPDLKEADIPAVVSEITKQLKQGLSDPQLLESNIRQRIEGPKPK